MDGAHVARSAECVLCAKNSLTLLYVSRGAKVAMAAAVELERVGGIRARSSAIFPRAAPRLGRR